MSGRLLLHGGGEFAAADAVMDAAVLPAPGVRAVVVALAARPGADHDRCCTRAVAHFAALGADAVAAPDARRDPAGARAAIAEAGVVVLPGGSPTGLLTGLRDTGLDEVVAGVLAGGGGVWGASAGAMVACGWTILPEGGLRLVRGLGLVGDAVVLPHFRGATAWWDAVAADLPAGTAVLGLPENSGLLLTDDTATATGASPVRVLAPDRRALAPGESRARAWLWGTLPG